MAYGRDPRVPIGLLFRAQDDLRDVRGRHGVLCLLCAALAVVTILALALAGCQLGPVTPTPDATLTQSYTPTPTVTSAVSPAPEESWFHTYAHGEILPDMRVPIQRSASGEGGWYVIISTEEGWAQFLAQMGQPAEIWEPVHWDEEILIGALLGVRAGRGFGITIGELDFDGLTLEARVSPSTPTPGGTPSTWITYPFHFVRVPRAELPLGPIGFRFLVSGKEQINETVDLFDQGILWLPGEKAVYPTPTRVLATSTPEPTATATPVPNLQVQGTLLEVEADTLTLHIVPFESEWEYVELAEVTSIFFKDGGAASLAQLVPGTTIIALGYPGQTGSMRAVHIDILALPTDEQSFAPYRPRNVSLSTIYDGYDLPLAAETVSSTQPLTQPLGQMGIEVLARNGFVIVPGDYPSFASLHADNELSSTPLFISTDSVLHLTQMLLDHVLRSTELTHTLPELTMLDREMFKLSWSQYQDMTSEAAMGEHRLAAAALRNAAYFAVPLVLLDPEFVPPEALSSSVKAELSLIAAGRGITVSPALDRPDVPDEAKLRLDYSQFAPAGRYTPCAGCAPDPQVERYFQALTWHRQVPFRLDQLDETRCAALIAHTLATHPATRVLWQRIQVPLAFFEGQDASFTPEQYRDLLGSVWGEITDITVLNDDAQLGAFVEAVRRLSLPDNPMWTIWQAEQPLDRDWRFLSPPFRVDPYILQQTSGEYVGDPDDRRMLPSGIDLAAALGSLEAYRIASQTGDAAYTNYVERVDKVRNELSALRVAHWTEGLYWNWLYIYRSLLQDKSASYPGWMRTSAWKRKELQTVLASWTYLQHDTPLSGVVMPPEGTELQLAPWGYVEPQPEVYAHLAALTRMILDGLDSRLMLSAENRQALTELETWLITMEDMGRRELTSQVLSDAEYRRLAEYPLLVQKLSRLVVHTGTAPSGEALREPYQEAIAVSVATAAGQQRIESTGRVDRLCVVVERSRQPYLACGGVYSYYEWVWSHENPLQDRQWLDMLDAGRAPPRPVWVKNLIPGEQE